jgi:hypothetical protein
MARVGRATFYQWAQRDPTFAAAVDDARAPVPVRVAEAMRPLEEKTSRELIAMLKRLHPRYR